MHKVNAGYTVLVRIAPGRVDDVNALLAAYRAAPARLPFERSPSTHFATVTVLPVHTYREEELPATLMIATSFCGPADAHVAELVRVIGVPLRELLALCEGFTVGCSDDDLEDFLRAHREADTFYSGMQHLSRADVEHHRALRDAIETYIEDRQANGGFPADASALEVRRAIQDHVKSLPGFAWAEQPCKPSLAARIALTWRSLIVGAFVVPFVVLLVASTVACFVAHGSTLGGLAGPLWLVIVGIVVFFAVIVALIYESEVAQREVAQRQPDSHVRALAATQNRPVINEFVIVGPVKEEGRSRPFVLRLAFWIVARVAEGIPWSPLKTFRDGINIPTVATARWIAADRGRRLVFISNYTNSAEPYVRDFIDVHDGAKRINLTFGFGKLYPMTRFIMNEGALTDPNGFIYVVTANQHFTGFWFGPYGDLSIDNIKVNRKIREGLFAKHFNETKAKEWLRLL